jgi:hypothetical protein
MQEQAGQLSEAVSVFKLEGDHDRDVHYVEYPVQAQAGRPVVAPRQPPRVRQAIAAPQRKPAMGKLAVAGDGWERF